MTFNEVKVLKTTQVACAVYNIYIFLSFSRFALVEYFSLDGSTGLLSVKRRISTGHWNYFRKNIVEIDYNVLQ